MKINFRCAQENKRIGSIDVPNGATVVLDPGTVWNLFRPESQEYQLPNKIPRDGSYLHCPHCSGKIEVENSRYKILENEPSGGRGGAITREEARRRIKDAVPADEYVDGGADSSRPFVFGARIK